MVGGSQRRESEGVGHPSACHRPRKGPLVTRLPKAFAITGALALLLTGCDGTRPALPSPSPSAEASDAFEPCVADPAAVMTATLPPTATGPMPADLAAVLDTAVTSALPEAATPGALVGVRSPQGTWVQAYGIADPAANTPMTTDVSQRIGSITKTFTGTLVLQLVQEGAISLDDPVSDYVSDLPNGSIVTVRQLLDMTSGLASYTLDEAWQATFFADPYKAWKPDELVEIARNLDPLFTPGERFDYSNTNTVLLGKIVEKVTGQPIADALRQRIFDPLALEGTSFPGESPAFPEPHAQGFTLQSPDATPEHSVNATDWNPSWGWTAGEIISTGADLLDYGRALGTGQGLLPADVQEQRLTSFPGGRDSYSYGLAMGCVGGWVGHTGELPGFNSALYYQTDSDTTVAVLTNSDIASGDCEQSMTLTSNPTGIPCSLPAGRILAAIAAALGYPFDAPPQR